MTREAVRLAVCAHTEYECDCDCVCRRDLQVSECDWPDCECGCSPACRGCSLLKENAYGA